MMTRKKTARAGLDRERARRLELDRTNVRLRLAGPAAPHAPPSPAADDTAVIDATTPAASRADLALPPIGVRLPGQHVACLWCGVSVSVKARGPLPRFCSANCRHRAWEQARAARDGRSAVVAVDRVLVVYPVNTSGWVTLLERLAQDVQRDNLDDFALTAALGLVHIAIANRPRHDRRVDPL